MISVEAVRSIVASVLQLGTRGRDMKADAPLLGAVPELDSMAVVGVITSLEEHFGIAIGDDEIDAETFATLGSLARFIDQKLLAG